jgi:hypothetical protein
MIAFTPEALAYLDEYLAEVRAAVAGHDSLAPEEIEQDVRDHVYAALQGSDGPITAAQLAAVLDRLGPPAGWVGEGRRSVWKYLADKLKPVGHRAVEHIKALPGEAYHAGRGIVGAVKGLTHDWRLAYIAFGLFALGVIAFPLFPAFLIASYFAARADVSLARERGQVLGARRWLVYPPLVIVSVVLFLALSLWPIAPCIAAADGIPRSVRGDLAEIMNVSPRLVEPMAATYLVVGALSLWWGILALVSLRFPGLAGAVFPPFGAKFRRVDSLIVLLLSATVFVIWLAKADTAWRVFNELLTKG